jgi:hypothetical protein
MNYFHHRNTQHQAACRPRIEEYGIILMGYETVIVW